MFLFFVYFKSHITFSFLLRSANSRLLNTGDDPVFEVFVSPSVEDPLEEEGLALLAEEVLAKNDVECLQIPPGLVGLLSVE